MKNITFRIVITLFVSVILASTGIAQKQAPSADAILNKAYAKAAKEKKNVFLMFHASWCVWCRVLDTSLNDISCRKFINDNYVITHLDIKEKGTNKKLENAGADKLFKKYSKLNEQIPFWLIFNSKGKLLSDGFMPDGNNIGCPVMQDEVDAFIEIIKKTSRLKESELAIIAKRLRDNEARTKVE